MGKNEDTEVIENVSIEDEIGKNPTLEQTLYKYRFPLLILLTGLILTGFGVLYLKNKDLFEETKVEIIGSENGKETAKKIVVEIAGAVEKPGVYTLANGSRVDFLLVSGGGLSADADRIWVEKHINRAAILSDGQKIFIPKGGSQTLGVTANPLTGGEMQVSGNSAEVAGVVNINTSTQKQLEDLPGIGPVYAKTIIEQRPYSSVEELLTRSVLKKSVYEKIKGLVVVF